MFRFYFLLLTSCLLVALQAKPVRRADPAPTLWSGTQSAPSPPAEETKPESETDSQVLLRYEVFRLPKTAAETLRKSQPKDTDLYAALQQSVQAGSTVADKMILLRTMWGEWATVRQAVEFPHQDKERRFTTETLGEVLTFSPEVSEEGDSLVLKITSTTTRLGPVQEGKPTFFKAEILRILPTIPNQPSLLGQLAAEPANPAQADTVALAFVTPTVQRFPAVNSERPERRTFRCQYEVISLPQATALMLIQTTPDNTELYGKLNGLISAKVGKLGTLQIIQANDSQRGKVEHIDEFPYPTDFDPGQTVTQLTITDPALKEQLLKRDSGQHPLPAPNAGSSLTIPAVGTTFTVRNLGNTLELENYSYPDGSVSVTVAAEKGRLLSMERDQDLMQPSFGVQKINTTVRVQPNHPLLIGTLNHPQDSGAPGATPEPRVWLAFLTLRK